MFWETLDAKWGVLKPWGGTSGDLCIINEAVVPLQPVVPNPYTLLSEIPERAKYFSVIDLKDAFYSVPLAEESQFNLPLKTLRSQLLS